MLLIMGFGGTLDDWTPAFVASLSRTHHVITFDNAGIGRTSALPTPLTASAMADQTAALIDTLHTGPVDVLGWSMGGMIAQALAVEHPELVSHLVLAATVAGNGTATLPAASVLKQLTESTTDPLEFLALLFPSDASAAADAYLAGILTWPDPYLPSQSVYAAQEGVLTRWVGSSEPAGRDIGSIAVPTLIADGTSDVLVPTANAAALAAAIHGSEVTTYPHAGHAFLFQDQDLFLTRVAAFLNEGH
jgi:pimeloyl-ACP methyl ester carboxylesterase